MCTDPVLQVYFCVGFVTSVRLLAFWGTLFMSGRDGSAQPWALAGPAACREWTWPGPDPATS